MQLKPTSSPVVAAHAPTMLGAADGQLVLRVLGPEHHGRELRLGASKCTIGSGPHCTLRLRAHGVRDVHCLILRGRAGTYVRRWHADTCLNDAAFTDSPLNAGDRLHVGPVELEIVDAGTPCLEPNLMAATQPSVLEPRDIADQLQDTAAELSAALAAARAELAQAQQDHARDLERSQSLACELEQSQQQLSEATTTHQQKAAEWQQVREALQQEIALLTEQNQTFETELAERRDQMEQAASQLRAETARLIKQLESANATIREKTRRITELETRVDLRSVDLTATQHLATHIPENPSQLGPQVEANNEDRPGNAPLPTAGSPADAASQGPRGTLVLGADFQPQTPASDANISNPATVEDNSSPAAPSCAPSVETHDSEIQSYMQRLLERVKGGQQHAAPTTDQSCQRNQPCQLASRVPTEKTASVTAAGQVPEPVAGETAWPRNTTPESSDDLAVLRQLANLNVHTSLTKADRRRYVAAAIRELIMATGTLTVGGIAIGLSGQPFSGLWLTGLVGLGTGAFMTVRGLRYILRARKLFAPQRTAA